MPALDRLILLLDQIMFHLITQTALVVSVVALLALMIAASVDV
jgi:hypothetical protein